MIENHSAGFQNPCQSPASNCKHFCKNLALVQKHLRDPMIQKLLRYMSHPARFDSVSRSWTIPFCFQGNELEQFQSSLKAYRKGYHANATHKPAYGYEFCTHVKQTLTDIGLCTTLKYDNMVSKKN